MPGEWAALARRAVLALERIADVLEAHALLGPDETAGPAANGHTNNLEVRDGRTRVG